MSKRDITSELCNCTIWEHIEANVLVVLGCMVGGRTQMWRVQGIPHSVFEFLPRYRSFQVFLEGAEVEWALIAQSGCELSFDVTGGGKGHG